MGLAYFIIGSGLIVPNGNCIIGKLFRKDDPLRDSGFTIVYIGINVGSLVAATSSGFISTHIGYGPAFIASFLLLIGCLILFLISFKRLEFYSAPNVRPYKPQVNTQTILPIIIAIIIAVPIVAYLLDHATISNCLLMIVGAVMIAIIVTLALREKEQTRRKLFGFLIFIIFGVAFWALYSLAPSALTIFIKNNVDRMVNGFVIPTASVYGLNPFFIITIGTLTSWFFLHMSRKGRIMPLRFKFALGIASMGLGYVVLKVGITHHNPLGYIGFGWIVLSYFFQTFGELFVAPIGYAMVGTLVPARLEGMMMGAWQLSTGIATAISGFLASATTDRIPKGQVAHPLVTNPTFSHYFGLYGLVAIGVGVLIILLTPWFKRLWA